MANFQDVLNGLTTINGKVATSLTDMRKNIANFVGDGFVELGDLTYANGQIRLSNAQVLVKGARLNVTLSSTISNNQSCYIRVASDFTFALQVFSNISTTDGLLTVTTPDFNSAYTYIKVAEIYNSALHDCRSLLIKANSLANSLYHAQIATSSWTLNQGLYEFVITHNMGTKHLYVSMVSTSDNSSMVFAYDILNDNQIKVYSDTNIASEVCIISKSNQYNVTNDFIDDTNIATTKTLSSNEIVKRLNEIKNANSTFTNIVSNNLAVADLNNVTKNGYFYTSPSTLNLPTELVNNVDKYCILLNIIEYDKEGYQLLIPISGEWINTIFKRVIYDQGNSRTEWTYALDSGRWATLQTTNKTIIGAINEVFQLGNNVKRNLVDALVAKGVSCSTSDSFDSLINNVANMQTNPLDISSATSLPSTGKDKQICIVTDNPVNNFIVSSNFNDKSSDTSKIMLYLSNTTSNDASEGTLLSIPSGNTTINYYFAKACQGEARLASYYWSNNKWNELTKKYLYFLENKELTNNSYFGGIYTGSSLCYITPNGLFIDKNPESVYCLFTTMNKINFSLYSKMDVTAYASEYGSSTGVQLTVGMAISRFNTSTTSSSALSGNFSQYTDYITYQTNPTTYTFNISSITGEGYLGFHVYLPYYVTFTITDIRLY